MNEAWGSKGEELPYRHQAPDPWGTVRPAGFGIRAFARLVDLIARTIVSAVFGAVFWVAALVLDPAQAPERAALVGQASRAPLLVAGLAASVLYHAVTECFGGATIGKWVCGLRVTTEGLGQATFGGAVVRNLAFFVDALFFGAVGYSAMSQSARLQRYGDRWGGTVVVYAEGAPEAVRGTVGRLLGWAAAGILVEGGLSVIALAYQYSTL